MSAEVRQISDQPRRDANWFAARDQKTHGWMLGDSFAILFLHVIGEFVELWDDLIDKDKDVTDARLNEVLMSMLVGVACNPFVAAHGDSLRPAFALMYQQWRDSEELKSDPDRHLREMAFHLRNAPLELYQLSALLVGGPSHLAAVSADIRRFFATERFDEWEHAHG